MGFPSPFCNLKRITIALLFTISFALPLWAQPPHDADLPIDQVPNPFQLYQRLAQTHSLPSIAEGNAAKYKELLKGLDSSLLKNLSAEEKSNLRNLANQVLSKANSPEQIQQLQKSFENYKKDPPSGITILNPSQDGPNTVGELQKILDRFKNLGNQEENPDPQQTPPPRRFNRPSYPSPQQQNPDSNGSKSRSQINSQMNRLLFNAAKNAIEKQAGRSQDVSSSDGTETSNWRSFWHNLAESAKEHIDDPSFKARYGDEVDSFLARVKSATSGRNFYDHFRSDGPNRMPGFNSFSSSGIWIVFLTLAAVAVGIGFVVYKNRAQEDTPTEKKIRKPNRISIPAFSTNSELVNSVDELICWMSDSDARWWHARQVRRYLQDRFPSANREIAQLVKLYEKARYREPTHTLSPSEFSAAHLVVEQLQNLHADSMVEPTGDLP
jgi:hypothetical protein